MAAVYLLAPTWLAPLTAWAPDCAATLAVILRLKTLTERVANPFVGQLSSAFSLPEQPLAKGEAGWVLATFLAAAAFLVALALAVMVRHI